MKEVDINTLVNYRNDLLEIIPKDIIIVGKLDKLTIQYKYDKLDLSRIECNEIWYFNQEGEDIKNHILPNSLKGLFCSGNQLTSLPELPNSLKELFCSGNQLTSLPKLPNCLKELRCNNNELTSLPKLPNCLKELYCTGNQLSSLPDVTHIDHKLLLSLNQDLAISFIPYNKNLILNKIYKHKIIIKDYPYNPITNQDELDQYMRYIKNYQLNRIKSARK